MNRYALLAMLMFQSGLFAKDINSDIGCINYTDMARLEREQGVFVDEEVKSNSNSVEVCKLKDKIKYSSFKVVDYKGLCLLEVSVLVLEYRVVKYKNNNSVSRLYSDKYNGLCPSVEKYTELTNLSSNLDPLKTISMVQDFKKSIADKDERYYGKYFSLSLLDKYLRSDYSEFVDDFEKAEAIQIEDISQYMLTNDDRVHLMTISIDGKQWLALAEIGDDYLRIKKLSTGLD